MKNPLLFDSVRRQNHGTVAFVAKQKDPRFIKAILVRRAFSVNATKNKNRKHILPIFFGRTCFLAYAFTKKRDLSNVYPYFFSASSTATATATVAPTMGLLPMPRKPIISTCAGTEEEPANCASECIRPMVSVMP